MKFLPITAATIIAAAFMFASPSFAAYASMDDNWSGIYNSPKQLSDGTYQVPDPNLGTRVFAECKRFADGHAGAGIYCRGDAVSSGNAPQNDEPAGKTDVMGIDLSGPTKFAVFKHERYYDGTHNAARLNNGTGSNVERALQRCAAAGENCIIVEADGPDKAFAIARAMGWPV